MNRQRKNGGEGKRKREGRPERLREMEKETTAKDIEQAKTKTNLEGVQGEGRIGEKGRGLLATLTLPRRMKQISG